MTLQNVAGEASCSKSRTVRSSPSKSIIGIRSWPSISPARKPAAATRPTSGSTIWARCASRKWTRPASTSRCSRTARPRPRSCRSKSPPSSRAQVNDRLAKVCAANPKRFAAFAALPTVDPKAAADELERAVTKLGFKGAMLHGMTNGEFLDLQEILADLRARREARRADLFPSLAAASEGDGNLLPGLRQGLPAGGAPGLGLHGGDRDAGDPAGALRRVRRRTRT